MFGERDMWDFEQLRLEDRMPQQRASMADERDHRHI